MGGSICVWDIQRNEEVLWLHGHHGPIRDLAFSFDGTDLMSSSSVEATTRIWDLRTSSCRDILSGVVDPATVFSRKDRSTFWPVGHPGELAFLCPERRLEIGWLTGTSYAISSHDKRVVLTQGEYELLGR
jgi:WD40 repeat protein